MLYIVLAYLMLFAALSNAVCLYNASFLPMISANAFNFYALSLFIERAMSSPEKYLVWSGQPLKVRSWT